MTFVRIQNPDESARAIRRRAMYSDEMALVSVKTSRFYEAVWRITPVSMVTHFVRKTTELIGQSIGPYRRFVALGVVETCATASRLKSFNSNKGDRKFLS
eukprot:4625361-Pleurochrysis_carterae.AAC.2